MPNLRHRNFEVTEIVPIGKYICRVAKQTDLLGKTLRDETIIDSFISKTFHARNIYLEATTALENENEIVFEQQMFERLKVLRETFLKEVGEILKVRDWYMGYLTLADFFLFNVLVYFIGFVPSLVTEDSILEFMKRFEALEPLKAFFKNGKANYPPGLADTINKKWKGKKYDV